MPSYSKAIFPPTNEFEVNATRTVHHAELHPKLIRHKLEMRKKREPIPQDGEDAPYQSESKKLVNLPPHRERHPQHELARLRYSPANCNCCWSKDNKWYRRHHSTLKKKGDNKDNVSGHWMRRQLFRPPSYVSKYVVRQEIAEALAEL